MLFQFIEILIEILLKVLIFFKMITPESVISIYWNTYWNTPESVISIYWNTLIKNYYVKEILLAWNIHINKLIIQRVIKIASVEFQPPAVTRIQNRIFTGIAWYSASPPTTTMRHRMNGLKVTKQKYNRSAMVHTQPYPTIPTYPISLSGYCANPKN